MRPPRSYHAHHDCLVCLALGCAALGNAAGIGFVDLDVTGERAATVGVCVSHQLAEFVGHTPSALIGDA